MRPTVLLLPAVGGKQRDGWVCCRVTPGRKMLTGPLRILGSQAPRARVGGARQGANLSGVCRLPPAAGVAVKSSTVTDWQFQFSLIVQAKTMEPPPSSELNRLHPHAVEGGRGGLGACRLQHPLKVPLKVPHPCSSCRTQSFVRHVWVCVRSNSQGPRRCTMTSYRLLCLPPLGHYSRLDSISHHSLVCC